MARAFLVVMDSVGIGGAPDAAAFGDSGSNTLGHIVQACADGLATDGRQGPLQTPTLDALGLRHALGLANGDWRFGAGPEAAQGMWGAATELSQGKDTPSGHWELAGLPVPWDWHYFPATEPAFPEDLVAAVCAAAGTQGILGNRHASGTVILEAEGARHMQTGYPICYTSADSVFQIAAHEETFGLQRLLDLCEAVAPLLHEMRVGRVIARPFVGDATQGFTRTTNRRDYAIVPPAPTLMDWVQSTGGTTHTIGKIADIFAQQGVGTRVKGADAHLMEHLAAAVAEQPDGSLTFANFVEFDSLYGHRRDVSGYARALEWFDAGIAPVLAALHPGDLMILTADHGNDPTWTGTDHTRERVPVLATGPGFSPRALGHMGFADVAATVAAHLNIPATGPGRSVL
jgi:phosphopentomutase